MEHTILPSLYARAHAGRQKKSGDNLHFVDKEEYKFSGVIYQLIISQKNARETACRGPRESRGRANKKTAESEFSVASDISGKRKTLI